MQTVLIFGATSTIAIEIAKLLAKEGYALQLVARDAEKLAVVKQSLLVLGATEVNCIVCDFAERAQVLQLSESLQNEEAAIETAIFAHGLLPDQIACQQQAETACVAMEVNFSSHMILLSAVANRLEQQQSGKIIVIASVAADRGRASNYFYGSAKAALVTFTQGLRQRLAKSHVSVITVKPGIIETAMTAHLRKSLLWGKPERVAAQIIKAWKKNKEQLYTPGFWYWIMFVIKIIPERLFKKLRL